MVAILWQPGGCVKSDGWRMRGARLRRAVSPWERGTVASPPRAAAAMPLTQRSPMRGPASYRDLSAGEVGVRSGGGVRFGSRNDRTELPLDAQARTPGPEPTQTVSIRAHDRSPDRPAWPMLSAARIRLAEVIESEPTFFGIGRGARRALVPRLSESPQAYRRSSHIAGSCSLAHHRSDAGR